MMWPYCMHWTVSALIFINSGKPSYYAVPRLVVRPSASNVTFQKTFLFFRIRVFWYVVHCLVVNRYHYFRRVCFHHILGGRTLTKLYELTSHINDLHNHGHENLKCILILLAVSSMHPVAVSHPVLQELLHCRGWKCVGLCSAYFICWICGLA